MYLITPLLRNSTDHISSNTPPGLAVLESPPFLNGEIGRRIGKQLESYFHLRILSTCNTLLIALHNYEKIAGWFKSTVTQVLSAEEKNKEYRYNAATFLVSYLLGSPIQEFDLEPNR
jgi:hypothetical protein